MEACSFHHVGLERLLLVSIRIFLFHSVEIIEDIDVCIFVC